VARGDSLVHGEWKAVERSEKILFVLSAVVASVYFVVCHGVAQSVEALRYKREGSGFDS
jgi:hypothetical protein